MASYSHLTNDNGVSAISAEANHLAGLTKTSSHLVRVKKMTDWTDKELVITPTDQKFTMACACGLEEHPTVQPCESVSNDTGNLINRIQPLLNGATWVNGNKAIFNYFTRRYDPYKLYLTSTPETAKNYCGVGYSCVAYKFDFRNIPLNKASSYSLKLRAYQPSQLYTGTTTSAGSAWQDYCCIEAIDMVASTNVMNLSFVKDLPEKSNGFGSSSLPAITFTRSMCNNKTTVRNEYDSSRAYDMFGWVNSDIRNNSGPGCYIPPRIWLETNNITTDVQITNTTLLNFIKNNPGEFWAVCQFRVGNGFSTNTGAGYYGVSPRCSANMFIQKIALVLKLSLSQFNLYDY